MAVYITIMDLFLRRVETMNISVDDMPDYQETAVLLPHTSIT